MFKRPTPELVAAKRWEIKQRYERHAKVGRRSRGMAAFRLSELSRWLDDEFGAGVELEPCDRSETIIRVFVHHLMSLAQGPRRTSAWFHRYAPWLSLRDQEYLISEATYCPLKWSADKLAWKLRIKDEQRSRLKLKTIGAIDCNKDQRKARDRKRRADREKARRDAKRSKAVPHI